MDLKHFRTAERHEVFILQPSAGSMIGPCAIEAQALADKNRITVYFEFNEIGIKIKPGALAMEAVRQYFDGLERRKSDG